MIGELVERRGFPTQEKAVEAGAPLLTDGLMVHVKLDPDAPRKRSWVLFAWTPNGVADAEQDAEAVEPDPSQLTLGEAEKFPALPLTITEAVKPPAAALP